MGIICLKDVSYTYPRDKKYALQNINLSVMEGEFLAVMGETGAGKTTFCRLINGIIPHLSGGKLYGNVLIDGQNTHETSVPQLALKVGMVLDDPDAQLFTSTVRHEAAFGPENLCLPVEEIEQRINTALTAVGLDGFEDRSPATLSGGEKQRLSIAAALAMKGKILVLDEPLCRLDPQGAQEVMSVLKDIREKYRITVIMSAFDSAMMAEYADRVCILKKGSVAAFDTAKNIFTNRELLEENGIEPVVKRDNLLTAEFYGAFEPRTKLPETCEPNVRCNPVVEFKGFTFTYPNGVSIKNINISIAENDFAAIIGRNGCGKTTLLKSITGLLRPSNGDIFIRGKNTKALSVSDISREIGFVMQNPDTQLFTDSVYNEVVFALKNMQKHGLRLSKVQIKQRVQEALETTGLDNPDAFPHALNRADRTKTVIACLLAMGTKIILFDEVDAGDFHGNLKIMNIAKELHVKGYTIIFVTHNMSLADTYAHRLIKMDRKGIVFDGNRKQ
jgi:energy-coupling factor transport system ATP-binding protein